MISSKNIPVNTLTTDSDFTVEQYRELLKLAKNKWNIAQYGSIPWGSRFVLWRHDIDYSLNRSLSLAEIEHDEGVIATYFINPHSEFYNLAELKQYLIIQQILLLGHDLGLHFDGAFHNITSEADLNRLVSREASHLEELFDCKLEAFSFHNPIASHLRCDAEEYGSLINCYSARFKKEVAYCSDSNGYWRFRPLHEVLSKGNDPCLQVLTHPGWWQDIPMPPRQRIFRCSYGKAEATMRLYDAGLAENGRLNHFGKATALRFLETLDSKSYELCDYLWNQNRFQILFVELWRLHQSQINRLCKTYLKKVWCIPAAELNAFFGKDDLHIDGWKLFNALFDNQLTQTVGVDEAEYQTWAKTRDQLIHGSSSLGNEELENGCVYLCKLIENLAVWGNRQSINYDGLTHLGSIGFPTYRTEEENLESHIESVDAKTAQHLQLRWVALKEKLIDLNKHAKGER